MYLVCSGGEVAGANEADKREKVPRLKARALAAAAIREVRHSAKRLWLLWVCAGALYALGGVIGSPLLLETTGVSKSAHSNLLFFPVMSLLSAPLSAVTLRAFIRPEVKLLTLDQGLIRYTLATAMIGLLADALLALWSALGVNSPLIICLGLLAGAIGLWLMFRLSLWWTGLVLCDAAPSAKKSWSSMRGSVGAYFRAFMLISAPISICASALTRIFQAGDSSPALFMMIVLGGALSMLAAALQSTVYRVRMRNESPELIGV